MSWRTSLAGILALVSQLAALLPVVPPWLAVALRILSAVAGGAGLALARDHAAPPAPVPCAAVARALDAGQREPTEIEAAAIRQVLCEGCVAAAKVTREPVLMPLADAVEMARKDLAPPPLKGPQPGPSLGDRS